MEGRGPSRPGWNLYTYVSCTEKKKKKGPGQKGEAQAGFGFGLLGSAYLLESQFPFLGGPDPGLCMNCFTAHCNMRKTRFSKRCTVSLLGSQTSGAVGTAAVFSGLASVSLLPFPRDLPGTAEGCSKALSTPAPLPLVFWNLCLSGWATTFQSPCGEGGAGQQVTYPYLP